ncbi:MAG: hypothetical protein KTR31_09955 [Myxococcales bacterium]|nr:hypothetical protein [Myxococcales bacterium]
MLVSLLAIAVSHASPPQEAPLAIPAGGAAPAAERAAPQAVTVRDLPRTPSMAVASRQFQERSLDLRVAEVPVTLGPHWDWTRRVAMMGVYQGSHRLDGPQMLVALGDEAGGADLERRIGSNRMAATVLQAVGVAGVGGVVTGLIGRDRAETFGQLRRWQGFTVASVGVLVTGFAGSAIPRTRARQLRYDPMSAMDLLELEERIASHNRALAKELGVQQQREPEAQVLAIPAAVPR